MDEYDLIYNEFDLIYDMHEKPFHKEFDLIYTKRSRQYKANDNDKYLTKLQPFIDMVQRYDKYR